MNIRLGCNRWGRKEWVGKLYPPGLKEREYLERYSAHFNAIELTATQQKIYECEEIKKWKKSVEDKDFKFCPHFPETIRRFIGYKDLKNITVSFIESIRCFGNYLGPALLNLSPKFSPDRADPLFNYLSQLPKDVNVFVELLQREWFEAEQLNETIRQLNDFKIGMVDNIAEKPLDISSNSRWLNYDADADRINIIMEWIDYYSYNNVDEVFIIVRSHDPLKQLTTLLNLKEQLSK